MSLICIDFLRSCKESSFDPICKPCKLISMSSLYHMDIIKFFILVPRCNLFDLIYEYFKLMSMNLYLIIWLELCPLISQLCPKLIHIERCLSFHLFFTRFYELCMLDHFSSLRTSWKGVFHSQHSHSICNILQLWSFIHSWSCSSSFIYSSD